tara:strand:+ start:510 stop:950 length:441 start_codon:yes stop_codon:yes gene_type:complete
MKTIRITKEFDFEMAHALEGYDGLCANIHGHSYRLWVTVRGDIKEDKGHVKDGMLMDFSDLKKIVKSLIVDKYDHSLVLQDNSPHSKVDLSMFDKVFYLPYQPTSENLVYDFALTIKDKIPKGLELYKVILSETRKSFAEWNINDH